MDANGGPAVPRKTLDLDFYSDIGGIDVRDSVVYVGAFLPGIRQAILSVDLNSRLVVELLSFPLGDHIFLDLEFDSDNRIYSIYDNGSQLALPLPALKG